MTFENLYLTLVAAAPAITAILGIVLSVLKLIKANKVSSDTLITKFEEVREEVMNTKEYEDLKAQLTIAHQENIELKKKINELLTVLDKVSRE